MGMQSYQQGIKGEEVACKFIEQLGFKVLDRNFHSQQGEIDIVAKDQNYLVFVEVKYYSFRSLTSPLYAVRKSKRDSIIHAARSYLYQKKLTAPLCRFDVIAIYRKLSGQTVIDHIKNAFGV